MKPYWQSPDGSITVYHARCEDVIADVLPVREVALIHADPVYGNGGDARAANKEVDGRKRAGNGRGKARDYPAIPHNDKPYDPAPLLALDRPLVLWGANHYSNKVPGTTAWIVWDKRVDSTPDDGSDCELAWSNLGGALRCFRHVWRGLARASECGEAHLYPTQKPIALSTYVFGRAKLKRGDLLFVPYLGSGPDLTAAQAMGLRVVACDVSEAACGIAVSARMGAITPQRAAEPVGPLFARSA